MSLGKRGPEEKQEPIRIEAARLAIPVGHPFYERLNRLLSKRGFDAFAESACESFYSKTADRVWRRGYTFGQSCARDCGEGYDDFLRGLAKEHPLDLETGAVLTVTLQAAAAGDTQTALARAKEVYADFGGVGGEFARDLSGAPV